MIKKKLVIIGAGEFAEIAYEYFTYDSAYEVVAFSVEQKYLDKSCLCGLPVVEFETLELHYPPKDFMVFTAITSTLLNTVRTKLYRLAKQKGYEFATYISTKSFVWRNAKIGENTFIFEDNTIQPFTEVGNNVVMWSGNHIGHRSVIKDNCFISSHTVISGYCEIGENSFLGVNCAVADNIKIARDNFIALGSVINKDTEENKIYRGNPAEAAKISAKRFCRVKE